MIFEPSLLLLYLKTIYLLALLGLVGWALYPYAVYPKSRVGSWVAWQSLGTAFLLICGFSLTRVSVPAKWLFVVPLLLVFARFLSIAMRKYTPPSKPFVWMPNCEDEEPFQSSLKTYACTLLIILTVYFLPFIVRGTSGLYAYGGGDHSTYFIFSDGLVDRDIADIHSAWKDRWVKNVPWYNYPEELIPPNPNWSFNQFINLVAIGDASTYANQTIAIPFIALSPGYSEESYSAGLAIYLFLVCWATALFIGVLAPCWPRNWVLALSTAFVILTSPAMSLALKQTIPALFTWGTTVNLLAVLFYHVRYHKKDLPILLFGIGLTSCALMWIGALLSTAPLFLIGILLLFWQFPKIIFLRGISIVALMLLIGNTEFQTIYKLFSQIAGWQSILDYGLEWRQLLPGLMGVADFETMLSLESAPLLYLSYISCIGMLLGIIAGFYRFDRRGKSAFLILLAPLLYCAYHYMFKIMHYQVIRAVEFAAIVLVGTAAYGYASYIEKSIQQSRTMISRPVVLGILVILLSLIPYKFYIYKTLSTFGFHPRASLLDSNALRLSHDIQTIYNDNSKFESKAISYAMSYGAIQTANNEILYRRVPYLEAYEYDYLLFYNLDILSPKYSDNALLVYAADPENDIFNIASSFMSEPIWSSSTYKVRHTETGSGAALVGTGWLPPVRSGNQLIRYLRDTYDGGIFIWSEKPQTILIRLNVFRAPVPPVSGILSIRYGERTNQFTWPTELLPQSDETEVDFWKRLPDSPFFQDLHFLYRFTRFLNYPESLESPLLYYPFWDKDPLFYDRLQAAEFSQDFTNKVNTYLNLVRMFNPTFNSANVNVDSPPPLDLAGLKLLNDYLVRNETFLEEIQNKGDAIIELKKEQVTIDQLKKQDNLYDFFNYLLTKSMYLKNMALNYFENGIPLPQALTDIFLSDEFRIPVPVWGTQESHSICFAVKIETGNNVIRLTARNGDGARGGKDIYIGVPYKQTNQIPWLVFRDIEIVPSPIELQFDSAHLKKIDNLETFKSLASGINPPCVRTDRLNFKRGDTLHVQWSGISSPAEDDWVGLFPVGGDDSSRLSFRFTGGGSAGTLSLDMPPTAVSGQYEIRLFRHGGWDLVAKSESFSLDVD